MAGHFWDTHSPVLFTLQLDQPQLFVNKLTLPQSWIEFDLDKEQMEAARATAMLPHQPPSTLEEWAENVESVVDQAIRNKHRRDAAFPSCLPRSHRGRCKPRAPTSKPVISSTKPARVTDFEPAFEVVTIATRRKVKQTRRVQSLLRRLRHATEHHATSNQTWWDMHQEWMTILRCKCFKIPFAEWIANIPELGTPPHYLPTIEWINDLYQMLVHEVQSTVAKDFQLFSKMRDFEKFCDAKFHGSARAFASIRAPSNPPIKELQIPIKCHAELHWVLDSKQVVCVCDASPFHTLSPVSVNGTLGWMVAKHPFHITVQFETLPANFPLAADVEQKHVVIDPREIAHQLDEYWLPMWQRPPQADSDVPWEDFDNLMRAMPPIPELQISFGLPEWQRAIRDLKPGSARSFDAFSAEELKTVTDADIQDLSGLIQQFHTGFPQHMMQSKVCPLSKAEGATPVASQSRPICVMAMLYRLYASVVCKQVLRQWGAWFPASICGMLPSRGAFTAAYTCQALIEMAHHKASKIGGTTLDLVKCFNMIDHAAGSRLMRCMKLPSLCLQIWSHSIEKHQRYWLISGETIGPVSATCGYPEGDSHSVLVILAIALTWASHLETLTSNSMRCACYADNWSWTSSNLHDHAPAATGTLQVTRVFGLILDWGKTWFWAVDTALANQISQLLEQAFQHAIQRKHHARDLGLEIQYSGSHRHGHRKGRWEQGMQKLQKLQDANLCLSVKEHMVMSSVFPAMFHGSDIFPCSSDQLATVRSKTASAVLGHTPSMTPSIALLLTKPTILDPGFYVIQSALRQAIAWLRAQTEATQHAFFHIAATFTGHVSKAKGPAASLCVYLMRLNWQIDKQGFVHVDTFVKLHLVRDSFQTFTVFLQLAWQKDLVVSLTERFKLYHMPDISRADTVQILNRFPDQDRKRLLKLVAWGFQDGCQQSHWASDADGLCPFCSEVDSHTHRMYECAAFQHTRDAFHQVIHGSLEFGTAFDEILAVPVHPLTDISRMVAYQPPAWVLPDALQAMYERSSPTNPLRIYTDGSCAFPANATTRFAAFACVVDLCQSDHQRQDCIIQWKLTGVLPTCFQTIAVGRVYGEQTINRGETQAVILMGRLGPNIAIHTDSQYAIDLVNAASSHVPPSPAKDSNFDLVQQLREIGIQNNNLIKVKAHQDPTQCTCWKQAFHALGNQFADTAANHARDHLHRDWVQTLQKRHEEVEQQRVLLYGTCQYLLQLQRDRAVAFQQLQPEEQPAFPQEVRLTPETILQKLSNWQPAEVQQLQQLPSLDNWEGYCALGQHLPQQFFDWFQQISWPTSPGGPLSKEIGVSWLELAVSFSHFT